jgi:flagellar biosynthesis protein FliP
VDNIQRHVFMGKRSPFKATLFAVDEVLPPVIISVPFKILLFVLVDGWNLVIKSLVSGFL